MEELNTDNFISGNSRITDIYESPEEQPQGRTDSDVSWSDVFRTQRDEVHIAQSVFRAGYFNELNQEEDPEFQKTMTLEKLKADVQEAGLDFMNVTPEEAYDIFQSDNYNSYSYRIQRLKERHDAQQELAGLGGWGAFSAMMAAYATDPAGAAIDVAAGGSVRGATWFSKFMKGAGYGVFSEGLQEAIRSVDDTVTTEEYVAGVTTAALLSGITGSALGKTELDSINTFKNTKQWNIAQDIDVSDSSQGSVGAMLNTSREELGTNVPVPENSAVESVYDMIDTKGFIEQSRLTTLDPTNASQSAKSSYQVSRFINQELFGVGIQKDINVVRDLSGIEFADMYFKRHEAPVQKQYNNLFYEFAKENHGKNLFTAQFQGELQQSFSSRVGRAMLTNSVDESDSSVKAMAAAAHKEYSLLGKHLVNAGILNRTVDGNYSPRVLSYGKVQKLKHKLGRNPENIINTLIRESLESGRIQKGLEVDNAITEAVAKAYTKRLLTPPSGEQGFKKSDNVLGLDLMDREFIDELLVDSDLSEEALDYIGGKLDELKKPGKSSGSPRTEHRLPLDMETRVETFDGHSISMADLFEDDFQTLFYDYNRWAAAELALNKKGMSLDMLRNLEKEVITRAEANEAGISGGAKPLANAPRKKHADEITHAIRAIQGFNIYGVDPTHFANRGIRAAKKFSYATNMSFAGVNAVTESATNIASAQLKNFFRDSKDLSNVIKYAISEEIPDDLVGDVILLTNGVAETWAMNLNSMKHTADSTKRMSDWFSPVENFLEGASRVTTAVSGLSKITDASRLKAAVQGLRHLDDMAMGRKMPSWWEKRSLLWSLSPERKEVVSNYLRNSPNILRDEKGRLLRVDPEEMPRYVREYMEEFIYKMSTHNILDINAATSIKGSDNPIVSAILQFKSFQIGAFSQHLLTDLKYHDTLALKKLLYTGSAGMLMYMVNINLTYPPGSEERKELLSMDKVIKSGGSYAVNTVILPDIVDAIVERFTGTPLIGRRRTSELSSHPLAGIPAAALYSEVGHLIDLPGDLVRGSEMSKEQLGALFSVSMLDALWPTRVLKNYLKEDLPSERTKDKKELWFD